MTNRTKKLATIFLVLAVAGCGRATIQKQAAQNPKQPCAPNVTQEMKMVKATITEKTTQDSSWGDTHTVRCPENMRTVLPSKREGMKADDFSDKWYAEHIYCIPDGATQ